ncbi:glycine-N-acyltransferase-like protein 3 [Culicoides brevitarsis]|uniref:glycine-N-acyltransferase-like protein 3 n=1 Tax=Culicoides brevitarsis TaxID=469753 RepID=UPI00307CAFB2
MEVIPKGRNFRIVADKELLSVLDELQGYLPHCIKFHETIKTYLNDKVWQFYFYVTKDWPDVKLCLHFPGCTLTPNNELYESFGVFCPTDQLEYLSLLHDEDILIDWNKTIYVNFAQEVVINRLEPFYKNIGSIEQVSAEVFTYDINAVLPDIEKFPQEEVELRALSLKDVKDIHDLYPAGNMESIEVFQKLLEKLPGCGVFSRDGELLAWMVQSYYGAMFSMQTKPDHRRKGYGIWLAKTLTEIVIKRGYLPFVVIRPENNASKGLYKKLGFKKKFNVVRAIFTPLEKPISIN